jgi:hypothetical protein
LRLFTGDIAILLSDLMDRTTGGAINNIDTFLGQYWPIFFTDEYGGTVCATWCSYQNWGPYWVIENHMTSCEYMNALELSNEYESQYADLRHDEVVGHIQMLARPISMIRWKR